MANFKHYVVKKIISERKGFQEIFVSDISVVPDVENLEKAFNILQNCAAVEVGDEVVINSTAVDRNLGTGGYHIVLTNLSKLPYSVNTNGHIMKLRYTGLQIDTGSIEEHEPEIANKTSIEGMPVIVAGLHSQIVPAIAYLKKQNPNINIAYCMSDGSSLPIAMSNLIDELKAKAYIKNTITFNNAFGGDYEAINVYSALLAAKHKCQADVAVVCMGPGIVGSNSKFGFSGIEASFYIKAVNDLKGKPIYILRGSKSDSRDRHNVVSHHSNTVIEMTNEDFFIAIPKNQKDEILNKIVKKDNVKIVLTDHNTDEFSEQSLLKEVLVDFPKLSSMGRNYKDDLLLFEYSLCAGIEALKYI